jgi:NAD(P)-dependent dehydrogenase (short-subunit alcohol dehydrogenase family)
VAAPAQPRTALVTGSNRGIGLAVAQALAAQGLTVVLTARRRADAEAAAAIVTPRKGARVLAEELDLAREASVAEAADRLRCAGVAIDALVNNGGVLAEGDVLTTTAANFEAAVAVNLFGALWCCRAFVPGMLARGHGRVVNVSSGWGSFAEGLLRGQQGRAQRTDRLARALAARRRQGQRVLPRLGTHTHGRPGRRPVARAGRRRHRLARDAAGGRTQRRLLPRPRADRLVAARVGLHVSHETSE